MAERQDPEQILKSTVYRCVQHWLFHFLDINTQQIKPLPVELRKRIQRVTDILLELPDKILHIEIQTRKPKNMSFRMLQYLLLIQQQYPQKVLQQVVVYLTAQPTGDNGTLILKTATKTVLDFNYQVLHMCSLDEEVFLSSNDPGELILALLAKKKDPRQTIQKILYKLLELVPEPEEFANFVEDALVLARLRSLDRLFTKLVEPMPLFFKIVKEKDALYQFGKKEGIEQGISKGLIQGKDLATGVIRLYLKEKLSAADIAATLHIEEVMVDNILKESGLVE
jgi:predicted transposase/invertase (TIGR01784 family)